jgi:hypothetical protein
MMHNYGFGQAYYKDLLKRIRRKFILYFFEFYKNLHEFKSLNNLWDLNQFERKENPAHSTVLKAAQGPAAKAV